jgi:membrane fusion protein (multidrug efflux system)
VHKFVIRLSLIIVLSSGIVFSYVNEPVAQSSKFFDPIGPDKIYGKLRSRHITSLSSEIPTRIENIALREGDGFKKGEILVKLDCSLIQAQYEKMKAIIKAAKSKLSIEKRLFKLNSTSEFNVRNAETEMEKVAADMKTVSVRLSKCFIKAPFTGRVVELKMGTHQYAQVGKDILKIIDDQNLEIIFMVPSNWVTWLKPGYQFVYHVNETSKSYHAKVIQRGAKIDAVSRSILMIGATISKQIELIPGMSGIVQINPPVGD